MNFFFAIVFFPILILVEASSRRMNETEKFFTVDTEIAPKGENFSAIEREFHKGSHKKIDSDESFHGRKDFHRLFRTSREEFDGENAKELVGNNKKSKKNSTSIISNDAGSTDGRKFETREDKLFNVTANESKLKSMDENVQDGEEQEENEVCYPVVGCFAMGKPWKSALRPVRKPYTPEKIQTTLFYYSRSNLNEPKTVTVHPEINMNGIAFDSNKLTAIIVHGFCSSGKSTWMNEMKNVYLKRFDANVFLVDWEKGANLLNYLQVAGNTRVVGKQLGIFVNHLKRNHGVDTGKFHLIGHSLGAQICSYLAKDVPGMARLTALDPAQPAFEGFDKLVRLDKTDAEFVDVVHTSSKPFFPALGLGMIAPHGHVDFYMNGGFDQPGCAIISKDEFPVVSNLLDLAKFPVEVISKVVTCPHSRAHDFFIEAFNETENCIFWGHRADVKNVLRSITNTITQGALEKLVPLSPNCNKENCIPFGLGTRKSNLRGSFVVTTSSKFPYCISEPGIPPETEPTMDRQSSIERKPESFIQRISKKIISG